MNRTIALIIDSAARLKMHRLLHIGYCQLPTAIGALPHANPVGKISIIPHSRGALGYTIHTPSEDTYLLTSAELEEQLATLLGGRPSGWCSATSARGQATISRKRQRWRGGW